MDIFSLYRNFWDYCFNNPEKIKPTHVAIYSFSIEHCNRLGWKKKFGFPTSMVMEATGIKSYSVYKKHLDDLVEYGLIEMVELSKNQFSSNIIALKENCKANAKALDKAFVKHASKQDESIDSIDKQDNNITINKEQDFTKFTILELFEYLKTDKENIEAIKCYWNLFADKYSIAKITKISNNRKKKLNTRFKEPEFSITKILTCAKDQKFLLENTWFTFDWMIDSESNYIKVLEGNYKTKETTNDAPKFKI